MTTLIAVGLVCFVLGVMVGAFILSLASTRLSGDGLE